MKKYRDIINNAPDPELADKIMCASYILAKGQPNVPINREEMEALVKSMTLNELRINVNAIRRKKYATT